MTSNKNQEWSREIGFPETLNVRENQGAIKNGQYRESDIIVYIKHRTTTNKTRDKLKRWATRIPPKTGNETRKGYTCSTHIISSCWFIVFQICEVLFHPNCNFIFYISYWMLRLCHSIRYFWQICFEDLLLLTKQAVPHFTIITPDRKTSDIVCLNSQVYNFP